MRAAIAVSFLGIVTMACQHQARVEAPVVAKRVCPAVTIPLNGELPTGCARVTGDDVGRLPLAVHVGNRTVQLAEWTQVDAVSTDVVGFAAHLPPDVVFAVKAGGELYVGNSPRWLNPHGLVGPRVHGIDQVTFCKAPPRPAGCEATQVVLDDRPAAPSVLALAE